MNLQEKINEAKELGIKFNILSMGVGNQINIPFNQFDVFPSWDEEDFERSLDQKIKWIKSRSYLNLIY